jgi:hypothetical protein
MLRVVGSYSSLADELLTEAASLQRYLDALNNPACLKRPTSLDCRALLSQLPVLDTNDYRFLVRIPVPMNALSANDMTEVLNRSGDLDDRRYLLARAIYRHWVERVSNQRCTFFFECMNHDDRVKQYGLIRSSLGM